MKRKVAICCVVLLTSTSTLVTGQVPRSGGYGAASVEQAQRQRYLDRQREQQRIQKGLEAIANEQAAALRAQEQAQAAALRVQQETLLRERQEITNRVYLRYPQPISQENRIVGGELYSVGDHTMWKTKEGECVNVESKGVIVQQFEVEVEQAYGPPKSSGWERQGLVIGNYPSPRTVIYSRETRVPAERLFLKNLPDMQTVTTGQKVSVRAMRSGTVRVAGQQLECWDCGLPDTAENRKNAGIAIPTPEQLAAAEEEIVVALKEAAEKRTAAQQRALEAAAAKKQVTDAKVLKWHQELAAKGDSYGLFRMGEHYRDGDGVPRDLDKAREYFTKAVSAGSPGAANALSELNQISPVQR